MVILRLAPAATTVEPAPVIVPPLQVEVPLSVSVPVPLEVPPLKAHPLFMVETSSMLSVPPLRTNASEQVRLRMLVLPDENVTDAVPATSGMRTSSPAPGTRLRSQLPAVCQDPVAPEPVQVIVPAEAPAVIRPTSRTILRRHR